MQQDQETNFNQDPEEQREIDKTFSYPLLDKISFDQCGCPNEFLLTNFRLLLINSSECGTDVAPNFWEQLHIWNSSKSSFYWSRECLEDTPPRSNRDDWSGACAVKLLTCVINENFIWKLFVHLMRALCLRASLAINESSEAALTRGSLLPPHIQSGNYLQFISLLCRAELFNKSHGGHNWHKNVCKLWKMAG